MIFVERRRHTLAPEMLWRFGFAWALIAVIMVVSHWGAIRTLAMPDPDDTLRMVQVRDLLAGQSWWDLHQYRIAPPDGVLMHWSRLVDLPLWLVQVLLRPLLGAALAEQVALVAVPLLTLGCAMLLAARLAWRMLVDNELIFYTCALFALATPVTAQMQPLRIDHHGWQIVAVLGALNGLTARTGLRAGWISGLSIALGLTVSLELLPIAALFAAVLVLRAVTDRSERWTPAAFLQALAITGCAGFALTHGVRDLANHCDSLSPAWLAALVAAATSTTAIATLPRLPLGRVVIAYAVSGAISLLTLYLFAPECAAGPFANLDPLVRSFWYDNVHEGKPIWFQKAPTMAQMLVPPLLGLWAAIRLSATQAGWLRRFWGQYALLLAGLIILSVLVARASAFACAVGTVPLAWQVREWLRQIRDLRGPLRRIAAMLAVVLVLMPGVPLLAAGKMLRGKEVPPSTATVERDCDLTAAARVLNRLPPTTVFTQIDLGPQLLALTGHKVVATAHHRARQAMHDLIAASIGSADAARPVLARYGVRYVMVCPDLPETGNYRRANPQGFVAALVQGNAPSWLRPVAVPAQSHLLLWEITQP